MTYDNTDTNADGKIDAPVDNDSVSTKELSNAKISTPSDDFSGLQSKIDELNTNGGGVVYLTETGKWAGGGSGLNIKDGVSVVGPSVSKNLDSNLSAYLSPQAGQTISMQNRAGLSGVRIETGGISMNDVVGVVIDGVSLDGINKTSGIDAQGMLNSRITNVLGSNIGTQTDGTFGMHLRQGTNNQCNENFLGNIQIINKKDNDVNTPIKTASGYTENSHYNIGARIPASSAGVPAIDNGGAGGECFWNNVYLSGTGGAASWKDPTRDSTFTGIRTLGGEYGIKNDNSARQIWTNITCTDAQKTGFFINKGEVSVYAARVPDNDQSSSGFRGVRLANGCKDCMVVGVTGGGSNGDDVRIDSGVSASIILDDAILPNGLDDQSGGTADIGLTT